MTTLIAPTTERVLKTWLTQVVGVDAGAVLPADASTWPDGFVLFTTLGGARDIYNPRTTALVQLDFYFVSLNSNKAPWGKANDLAQRVANATYELANNNLTLDLGDKYGKAVLLSAWIPSDPRRISDQANDTARFMTELQIAWVHA